MSTSSFSSSEVNEVGGLVRYCGAEVPDSDTFSCCAAIASVMALYVSRTLFGSCGIDDKQGELISLSSLDR